MNNTARYPRRSCQKSRCGMGVSNSLGAEGIAQGMANVQNDSCLCDSRPISLAMAYVKDQDFSGLYEPCAALKNGTLFSSLNMPYCVGGRR